MPVGDVALLATRAARNGVAQCHVEDVDNLHESVGQSIREHDEVVHQAMEEGRRRHATVRQIDRRLNSWVRRYPDVSVQTVAAGTGTNYAEKPSSAIELAVVGSADAVELADLTTPNCHPIVGYPDCSVLVVRD